LETQSDIIDFAERSAKNSLILFIGDFSSTAVLAISSILVARLLGPENYGVYSISFVAPALLVSLIGLGLDSAAIRFSSKYMAEGSRRLMQRFMRMIISFRIATGFAASLICFILSDFMAVALIDRPSIAPYIRLLSAVVLFETLFSLLYGFFIGLNSARNASIARILMAVFKGFTAPVLIIFGLGVYGALVGHILGYIIPSLIGLLMLYFNHYRRLKTTYGLEEDNENGDCHLKETIKFSLPLYVSSLLALLLSNYQAILLAKYSSDLEIGCFRAAANISMILTVIVSPILLALFPTFSRLNSHGFRERIGEFLNLSVKYSSLIIIPLAALLACVSRYLVDVIYGAGYIQAGDYIVFYSMIHMLIGLGSGIFISLFNGLGETSLTLRVNIINLAIFMTIAPLLADPYSVPGILTSLLISNLITTLYAYDMARRRLGINLNLSASARIYASSIISAVPAAVMAYYLNMPGIVGLVSCSVIYAIVYLTVAPILKAINMEDLRNLERIFGGIRLLKPLFRVIAVYESRVMNAMLGS